MEIQVPGPRNEYPSEGEFNEALSNFGASLIEASGLAADELHALGPNQAKDYMAARGVTLNRRQNENPSPSTEPDVLTTA